MGFANAGPDLQHSDGENTLVTPQKVGHDSASNLHTPRAVRSLTAKLQRLGDSQTVTSFMHSLDTPTRRGVVAIEALAQRLQQFFNLIPNTECAILTPTATN